MTASPKSRRRVLVGVSAVATLSLGVGVAAGSRLMSPEDAAAKTAPPKASQITVPVEKKALSSKVVARGDTSFDGAVNVRVETSGLKTPAVVTGKVPKVGSTIQAGKALLEIAGRPVIGLPGVLPMYRSLAPGSKGPDVLQLEQTLEKLGYDPGTVDSKYDGSTARAVEELYEAAGYDAPEPDEQLKQAVEGADKSVDAMKNALRQAKAALKQAKAGPGKADTSVQQGAVDDAEENLADAQEALNEAEFKAGTPLPVSEVVYVKTLPRRVDDVKVERGGTVNGVVMSASGAVAGRHRQGGRGDQEPAQGRDAGHLRPRRRHDRAGHRPSDHRQRGCVQRGGRAQVADRRPAGAACARRTSGSPSRSRAPTARFSPYRSPRCRRVPTAAAGSRYSATARSS